MNLIPLENFINKQKDNEIFQIIRNEMLLFIQMNKTFTKSNNYTVITLRTADFKVKGNKLSNRNNISVHFIDVRSRRTNRIFRTSTLHYAFQHFPVPQLSFILSCSFRICFFFNSISLMKQM